MNKYCLTADEFALLSAEYDTHAIDFAYGLRMLQLCIESANEVFDGRLGYEEFGDWLEELSQHVSEGFEYLAQYTGFSESSDDSSEQEGLEAAHECDAIQLSDLNDLMQVVAEGLEGALDDSPAASMVLDASDEEQERLDHEVESVVEAMRNVGHETYYFLICARYHWGKVAGSDTEKSQLRDVTSLFGKKSVEREDIRGSEPRPRRVRAQVPGRFRAARADARVGTIKRRIERVFGLPEGSVVLLGPNGNALRADAKIGTLRRRWEP
ncbi:hypothetical protein [Caballeronia telluris]|uniref:Uncharacterized protein n=1 Tax=Caballeronia telluris TaxID=326475 RepID=A0A158KHA2_9BURK|nr:hypothetical protein [Caballeronia telluris]SAL79940.1 hypothetical protein AWB66_06150 [Caballeronia telluris]